MDFQEFGKIARLSRNVVVTEKIDGTNAQIFIQTLGVSTDEPHVISWPYSYAERNSRGTTFIFAGSRSRWITPGKNTDNCGFAGWVKDNGKTLLGLGEGRHYGEWWGQGIQRNYGLKEKRFSLFNVGRWNSEWNSNFSGSTVCTEIPLCHVVPVLGRGEFNTEFIGTVLNGLSDNGSYAAPGFMKPEGVVIYHVAGGYYFKKTIENDDTPKSLVK